MTTTTHTCTCKACNGLAFTAPEGYLTGTPKQVREMTHNYAHMTRNPVMGPRLAAKGIEAI